MEPEADRHPRLRRSLVAPVLAAFVLLASAASAEASTLTVNTTSDAAPTADECSGNPGDCSLRQAVDAAQPGDTVQLPAGDYGLTLGTDIDVTKSLTIEGDTTSDTTINGSQNSGTNEYGETARILQVDYPATVTIQNLTFTGGVDERDARCLNGCDSVLDADGGGALFNNDADVTLDDVAFTGNVSSAPIGGAVSTAYGTLTLNNVSFTNNSSGLAGALFVRGGTVTGDGITFQDDRTTCCEGGAAYLYGGATVTFQNTTVVDSAGLDGTPAIANGQAALTLDNDTLSDNPSDIQTDTSATTTAENTIFGAEGGPACEPAGREDETNDGTTGAAITSDGGDNIDQGSSCALTAASDFSTVDPRLLPIADNGGSTLTEALIAGSPALGDPASLNCPAQDQRGVERPDGSCDIGAFEAILRGAPTATTGDATNVAQTTADLAATINLDGEAGGYHFLYGTTNDPADFTASSEVAAGVPDGDTPETQTLSNLAPATTYYYEAVADNATASTAGAVQQFTTAPALPIISNVAVASVTDTTATITFSIDPEGSDAKYVVAYGPDENYGYFSQPTDLGSPQGPQSLTVTLTGLTPNSTYHFSVYAGTDIDHYVTSSDMTFTTDPRVKGIVGRTVTVTDSGTAYECPTDDSVTVDWGDDSSDDNAQIQCQYGQGDQVDYTVTDSHTYGAPGRYLVQINYSDFGTMTDVYAHIAPAPLANTELPQISGIAQQGQTLTATNGRWDGNPTSFHYQWQDCDQNGQNCTDTGTDSTTYTLSQNEVGHTVRVIVTATNDAGCSVRATSDPTAIVLPAAPSNTGLPQISNTSPQQGETLTVTNGSWDNGPTSYDYQWQDCGQDGNCTDVGTDSNSYTVGQNDVGETIDVIVTATNTGGTSTPATTAPTATVLPLPPFNTELPQISDTSPQQGQTLTVTTGSWDNNPNPDDYHYQWQDCDQDGQNCSDTGDDANTYTLTSDDVGQTIEVTVTAVNAGGRTQETVGPTATVTPLPPSSNGPLPQINGIAQQGQKLTVTNGSWDNNPTSYDYQWQDCDQSGQNCTNTGTDTSSYALGQSDVSHTVQVLVTATNIAGASTPVASNKTAVVQPAPPPATPNTPPAAQQASPSVLTTAPTVSLSGAGFSGSVTPNGLPTQAYFQYGLDPKYSGGGSVVYNGSTPSQTVGSDFLNHGIGPVAVSGLLPNALYHVRLVATNVDGTTYGPDVTFTTQAGPVPGLPALGKSVNIAPVSGLVLIEVNGKFVPLTELGQIPFRSVIDATHGTFNLITATGQKGKTQHGEFGGAVIRLTQVRTGKNKGLTTLTLLEGVFGHGPSFGVCKAHTAADLSATAASANKMLLLLHASAHGKFTTKGRYGAATVLGTKWTIADRCNGTLIHDLTDSVAVRDFVHHRTIILHAGQNYLAKAP